MKNSGLKLYQIYKLLALQRSSLCEWWQRTVNSCWAVSRAGKKKLFEILQKASKFCFLHWSTPTINESMKVLFPFFFFFLKWDIPYLDSNTIRHTTDLYVGRREWSFCVSLNSCPKEQLENPPQKRVFPPIILVQC